MVRPSVLLCLLLLAPGVAAAAPEQIAAVPPAKPPSPAPPTLPPASGSTAACLAALAGDDVDFRRLPADDDAPHEACGADVPLEVSTLPGGVALRPAAILSCPMARALAAWTRDALAPAALDILGQRPTALRVAGSYVCRRVNGAPRASLSQHAFANAIDIAGVDLTETGVLPIDFRGHPNLPPRTTRARFQRALRQSACAYFMTVIGPGGDAFHGDHFHFDLSPRKSGAKICD